MKEPRELGSYSTARTHRPSVGFTWWPASTQSRGVAPPLIDLMPYGQGFFDDDTIFFDDDTIDEGFYWPDGEWCDIPLDPNEVLAWMPLPTCNFDWQTPTDEYWERMKECYGW